MVQTLQADLKKLESEDESFWISAYEQLAIRHNFVL